MKVIIPSVALLLLVAPAISQVPQSFVGTWKVTWQGVTRPQEAKLVVKESGGTWQTLARNRNDPCVGQQVPISISEISPQEIMVDLRFSEVVKGCADAKVLGDNGKLTGKRGSFDVTAERD